MENYKRTELLGQGTYGKVYKAQNLSTGALVALKKTILTTDDEGVPPTTLREVSILRSLDSPYVVKLEEVVHTESRSGPPLLYLVFEFLDHDLKQFMGSKYGKGVGMEPLLAKHFTFQILLGLKYCHANSVMHRDLKPQNLLVDVKTKTIKLADFGLGRVFSLPVAKYTHEVITLWYRAPEILLGTKCYSTGVDMWSVGCILAEMIIGRPLFCGESEIEQLLAIFRVLGTPTPSIWPSATELRDWHDYPQWAPQSIPLAVPTLASLGEHGAALVTDMLQLDPARRISAIDALKSPYFDDVRDTYIDCNGNQTGAGAVPAPEAEPVPAGNKENNIVHHNDTLLLS
jgi:cyclin-dependent kinase